MGFLLLILRGLSFFTSARLGLLERIISWKQERPKRLYYSCVGWGIRNQCFLKKLLKLYCYNRKYYITGKEWKKQLNTLPGMNVVKEVNKTMEESESSRVVNP